MASDKVQVVFMVDTSLPRSASGSLEQYYRSLCLATVRILLYLSQFPIREHLNRVLWNFKLFNSGRTEKSAKTWQFHENRSEHIEIFFQQLRESLEQSESATVQSSHARLKNSSQKPVRLMYNALAAVVQDFIWDAPEIMSPIRPRKRGRVVRTKAAATSSSLEAKESDRDKNLIIILSSCPASEQETRKFCHGPSVIEEASEVPVTMATITEQLLPSALLTQLSSKGIAVHWVHTGAALTEAGDFTMIPPGLSLMSDVLKKAGGSLIPLSTLVTPLVPQLKSQYRSSDVCNLGFAKVSSSCSADSLVAVPSVSSIDSELMHPPSLPKARPSSLPSRELLSSLILPPPALLKDYLCPRMDYGRAGGGSTDHDRSLAALKENNLLWFSTRDGNVLFIVELHPVCRLLTPNLTKARAIDTVSHVARKHTAEGGGLSGRKRERQGAPASRRVLLRKKLSFSKALKNDSEGSLNQEAVGNPPRTQIPETNSYSNSENSIPYSTLSNEWLPSIMSTPSPSMVAIGLVKQSDLPLSWLDPTSVFSCNGLYVPRETRNTLSQSLLKKNENSHLDRNEIFAEKTANLSTGDNKSPEPPGDNSTPPPYVLVSPYYHGMNISPVVRLEKFPFSTSHSSRNGRSAQTDRRRRTASVPKDLLCSLSENSDKNKAKKLTRIKSLPSSPMVLCSKLPLLRCQDDSKPPLSLAVSPWLLQSKVREAHGSAICSSTMGGNVTQMSEEHISIDPEESLQQSGRYCSRQCQNLCLWLAKNSLLLVVKIKVARDGSSCLGVLQPVTSLVSTLSLLRPQHQRHLLVKLVDPPPSSKKSAKTKIGPTNIVAVPLKPKGQLSNRRKNGEEKQGPRKATKDGDRESSREATSVSCHEGDSFIASCASDCELYTGLQLLFGDSKSDKSLCYDSVQSSLLSALADAPPFTHLPLLPWFPYTQHSSVNHQDIERLQELQLDIKDGEYGEVQRKSRLLSALKELYSCGQVAAAVNSVERESSEPLPGVQDSQLDQPMQGEVDADSSTVPNVSSLEELIDWFLSQYEEQVKLCHDGDSLLRWSIHTLAQFQSTFIWLQLLDSSSLPPEEREASLWEWLQAKGLLLSSTQLGEKYEKMGKDKMEEKEQAAAITATGEKEGEGKSLEERRVTEHLLQILLHFEALKLCSSINLDTKKTVANTLVFLFRKLSLLANPGLVGSCLKKIILPIYLSSCQEVLTEVYNQLMLPLPSDLSSSPDRPLSPEPSATEGEEGGSSEEWTPLMSLEEPPAAPKLAELRVKRLARHTSFHDNQSHRQITVMNKKNRKRKRQKAKQKPEASNLPRRSPRIAKHNAQQQKGRSVCRSLFSRSMSVSCEVGTKRKREREEEGKREGTENQLAKRRKSIHSLQRHHTVVEGPTSGPFKSPRKSFYSGANVPRRITTPLFNTPPLKENISKIHRQNMLSPRILLNKEPSPAAIYSLLHGNMVSPQDQQDSHELAKTPCKSTKDAVLVAAAAALTVSPHVGGKLERTPESKGQSKDQSFTPLGHRGGSGLAPPRDLSLMLSPGVLASYLVSNTPSSLARSIEKSSTQLTTSHCASTISSAAAVGVRKPGVKSARILTYESEDPLLKNKLSAHNSSPFNLSSSIQYASTASVQPPVTFRTIKEERDILRTLPNSPRLSRGVHGSSLSTNNDCNIFLISPPDKRSHPPPSAVVGGSSECLLTDLDPSIENESASMMAFALSTPTKDDPKDFLDAFN